MCVNHRVATAVPCLYCAANLGGRSNHKGHLGYIKPRPVYQEPVWMVLKRRSLAESGSGASQIVSEAGSWAKDSPTMWEFLSATSWPDGESRATGSVTIFVEDGVVKCCVKDKAQSCFGFVSVRIAGDWHKIVEKALANDSLEWRKDRPFRRPPAKG